MTSLHNSAKNKNSNEQILLRMKQQIKDTLLQNLREKYLQKLVLRFFIMEHFEVNSDNTRRELQAAGRDSVDTAERICSQMTRPTSLALGAHPSAQNPHSLYFVALIPDYKNKKYQQISHTFKPVKTIPSSELTRIRKLIEDKFDQIQNASDQRLDHLLETQTLIDKYKESMSSNDYLGICNHLQAVSNPSSVESH